MKITMEEMERRELLLSDFQRWMKANGRTWDDEKETLGKATVWAIYNMPEKVGPKREAAIRAEMRHGVQIRMTPGKEKTPTRKPVREEYAPTKEDLKRCRKCQEWTSTLLGGYCDYLSRHHHRRGCKPGVGCEKFVRKEEKIQSSVLSLQSSVFSPQGTGDGGRERSGKGMREKKKAPDAVQHRGREGKVIRL